MTNRLTAVAPAPEPYRGVILSLTTTPEQDLPRQVTDIAVRDAPGDTRPQFSIDLRGHWKNYLVGADEYGEYITDDVDELFNAVQRVARENVFNPLAFINFDDYVSGSWSAVPGLFESDFAYENRISYAGPDAPEVIQHQRGHTQYTLYWE